MGFERIAFTALESSYSVASAMKRLPQLAEEAYAGMRSFNIPAGFVDKGGPFHLIAEGGPSAAETSLRLICRVKHPPNPALLPGDTVRAAGGLGAHVGELYKFATAAESRGFAAVRFDKRIAGAPARLPEEVSEFGGNILRDSLGFLYSKGKAGTAQIKHLSGLRAVDVGNISFLKGPRPLLPSPRARLISTES